MNEATKSTIPTSFVSASDPRINNFIINAQALMNNSNTNVLIRSRLYVLLYNMCICNTRLRHALSGTNNMCASVYQGLRNSLIEQLGPQNLIDVLRLLQLLTYERNFVVGNWTFDLINYLNDEM